MQQAIAANHALHIAIAWPSGLKAASNLRRQLKKNPLPWKLFLPTLTMSYSLGLYLISGRTDSVVSPIVYWMTIYNNEVGSLVDKSQGRLQLAQNTSPTKTVNKKGLVDRERTSCLSKGLATSPKTHTRKKHFSHNSHDTPRISSHHTHNRKSSIKIETPIEFLTTLKWYARQNKLKGCRQIDPRRTWIWTATKIDGKLRISLFALKTTKREAYISKYEKLG